MNLLSVENLSRHYGTKVLFEQATFGIQKGEKAGLIAPNGSGKTTLLRTLAGEDEPDSGQVTWNKDATVAYLPQEPYSDPRHTVLETLFENTGKAGKVLQDLYYLQENANSSNPDYQQALASVETHNAWQLDAKVKKVVNQLAIPSLHAKMGTLSGGQKKRVALAGILISEPDMLLMDEPTNHLDLAMTEWLENYLKGSGLTLIIVTHDRYFLERVCNRIFELEEGKLYQYEGNYRYYLEKKEERRDAMSVRAEKSARLLKNELKWMNRQPKARGTKSKARIGRIDSLKDDAKGPKEEGDLDLNVQMQRLGNKVLRMKAVSKSLGGVHLFEKFSYSFSQGEKTGITGKNGTGKSTFLNLIAGDLQPDEGKLIFGETIRIGYYRQQGPDMDGNKKVIDIVRDHSESITDATGKALTAEQFLERFMFPRSKQQERVSTLSGGEKKRLYLVTVLASGPNFLMLDEPTNDLDLLTINRLEEFLIQFKGCALVVTHDRYFLDKMIDHLFVFKGKGEIKDFPGNYSQFRAAEDALEKQEKKSEKTSRKKSEELANKPSRPPKMSYKDKRTFETLGKEIDALESRKKELEELLSAGTIQGEAEWAEVSKELSTVIEQIDEKSVKWLELAEYYEQ